MNLRATLLLLAALPGATLADTKRAPFNALAPLLAGTYTGTCKAKPAPDDASDASAIAVSADGKVRAPGVAFDLRDSLLMELSRTVVNKTPQVRAVFRTIYEESYFLLLPEGDGYTAAAKSDKQEFACERVKMASSLKERPLALSMAPALDVERTVACRRSESDAPRDTVFRLAQGQVRLDDQTLDLTRARKESLDIGQGRGMQYGAELADGRTFVVLYDDRGDIKEVGILAGEEPVIGCESAKTTR